MGKRLTSSEQTQHWMGGINKMELNIFPIRYVKPMSVYRHFKGNLYLVIDVATNTETSEKYVIYIALYGDGNLYARPVEMFLEEVSPNKENPTGQKHRFELFEG